VSRLAVLTLGVVLLASMVDRPGQAASASQLAAHRGGALLWPENSMLAFTRAVELGADFIEFDVHLSLDGEPVVIHDPTLDRTTTGTGPVRAMSGASLRALRLKDGSGTPTDERVPTLDEVVALAARTRRQMLVEIKVDERRQRYPGIEEKVLAVLDRHDMAGAAVVMAFERETWRRVRALRPALRAGALYSPRTLEHLGATLASETEAARREGVAFLGLHQALVNADTVTAAERAGLTLGVWTVNEAEALQRFIDLGVGVLITDRPDLVKTLLGR
jgi:glycerophosphoryl diester phosphodiesterase